MEYPAELLSDIIMFIIAVTAMFIYRKFLRHRKMEKKNR